jgi:hypothetical protein
MIAHLAVVLLCASASAATTSAPPPVPSVATEKAAAPAVKASTSATAGAPVVSALGVSTLTVSSLYTGDRVRDPFAAAGAGGPVHVRDWSVPLVVDIHTVQLRGILQDSSSDFALFKTEDGMTLVLRGGVLYDEGNKRVPGVRGRIQIKQKRAELITDDKDVQVYTLGETADDDK